MNIVDVNSGFGLISDGLDKMKEMARIGGFTARDTINGVVVLVNADSNLSLIWRDQQRGQMGYIPGPVGPYPEAELTDADRENDARVEAENEKRRRERQAEYDRKHAEDMRRFESAIAGAPPMELRDADDWRTGLEKNKDGYGRCVFGYAETWAQLMQKEMATGAKLEDVAERCSHMADIPHGITGFMYGCAVGILARCWRYGEDLRRWHNIHTQHGNEGEVANENGGVLNPALLCIGES